MLRNTHSVKNSVLMPVLIAPIPRRVVTMVNQKPALVNCNPLLNLGLKMRKLFRDFNWSRKRVGVLILGLAPVCSPAVGLEKVFGRETGFEVESENSLDN